MAIFNSYVKLPEGIFNKSYSTEVQGVKHAVDSNRFNAASNQIEMFLTSLYFPSPWQGVQWWTWQWIGTSSTPLARWDPCWLPVLRRIPVAAQESNLRIWSMELKEVAVIQIDSIEAAKLRLTTIQEDKARSERDCKSHTFKSMPRQQKGTWRLFTYFCVYAWKNRKGTNTHSLHAV